MEAITPSSKICHGPWTLYFHPQEESKWGFSTFVKVGTIVTWTDFWLLFNTLNEEHLPEGMFFLMRDPFLPLWENHQNIKGGWYSFCVPKENASNAFMLYSISSMIQKTQKNSKNNITSKGLKSKLKIKNLKPFAKPIIRLSTIQANIIIYSF